MSADTKTLLDALGKPFPQEAIKTRVGGGNSRFSYVAGYTIIHRLNDATGGVWDWDIKTFDFRPLPNDKYGKEQSLVVVTGILTIPGLGSRAGIGVQKVSENAGEDLVKGASTDALKKAATLFGVALELYGEDFEDEDRTQPAPRRDQQLAQRPNGQQRHDHARQHGKDPATNDAPLWNDIEEAREDDFRRSVQRAGGFTDTTRPAPPARTTPPAAQPVAPSAPQQPFTTAQFRKTLDRAHELLEDGAPYARLVDFLNAARPSMTAEQKEEARLELPKLQAKIAERDRAALAPPAPRPASYAG